MKLLQISNGYLKPIAFLNLVSNRRPEKYGFEEIKGQILGGNARRLLHIEGE